MGNGSTNLRELFKRVNAACDGRKEISLKDIWVLLEVVEVPEQTHTYYREAAGVENAPKMHRVVGRLVEHGLVKDDWNPEKATSKALYPTQKAVDLIASLKNLW